MGVVECWLWDHSRFAQLIDILAKKGVVSIKNEMVGALDVFGNYYNFYWSMVWPLV